MDGRIDIKRKRYKEGGERERENKQKRKIEEKYRDKGN